MTERDIKTPENPAQDDPERALLALFVNKFGQSLVAAYLRRHEVESPATREVLSDITYEFAQPKLDSFHILTADLRRSYRRGALSFEELSRELDEAVGSHDAGTGMRYTMARLQTIGMPEIMLPDLYHPEQQSGESVQRFVEHNAQAFAAIDERTKDPEMSLLALFVKTFGQKLMQQYLHHYLETEHPTVDTERLSTLYLKQRPLMECFHAHTADLRRAYRSGGLAYDDLAVQLREVAETFKQDAIAILDRTGPEVPDYGKQVAPIFYHDLFEPRQRGWDIDLMEMVEKYTQPLALLDRIARSRSTGERER